MADVLNALRSGTAEWHARVEGCLPVLDAGFNRQDYRRLIARFYGFYRPLEEQLDAAPGIEQLLPDWKARRKLPWLAADLRWLDYRAADLANLPRCDRLPALQSAEEILGCLYVTEGSTLGGQIISRHLEKSLALAPDAGLAFFHAYGKRTGALWSSFGEALRRSAARLDERSLLRAAEQTFEAFWLWFGPGC